MKEEEEQMDPHVEEVRGSLVQRLKLERQQYQQQHHQSLCFTNDVPSSVTGVRSSIPENDYHAGGKDGAGCSQVAQIGQDGDVKRPPPSSAIQRNSHNFTHYRSSTPAPINSQIQEPHEIESEGNKHSQTDQPQTHALGIISLESRPTLSGVSASVTRTQQSVPCASNATDMYESANGNDNTNEGRNQPLSPYAISNIASTNTNTNTTNSSGDDRYSTNDSKKACSTGSSSTSCHSIKSLPQHRLNCSGSEDDRDDKASNLLYICNPDNSASDEYTNQATFKKASSPTRLSKPSKSTTSTPSRSDAGQSTTSKDSKQSTNSEPKEDTSSDQSDGGYAASASSNDATGTSTSTLSSQSYRRRNNHHHLRPVKGTHKSKHKRDSYCSSDLADFSSGGSGCSSSNSSSPRISPFAAANLSEDSENSNSGNETNGDSKAKPASEAILDNRAAMPSQYSTNTEARYRKSTTLAGMPSSSTAARGIKGTKPLSSFPSRHRRRHHTTKNTRDKEGGLKTTGLNTYPSKSSTSSTDVPQYTIPDTWSFVERQLKRKINFEELNSKKLYEDQRKELDMNFKSAVKRSRHLKPSSSMSSVKSSLSNGSDGQHLSMLDPKRRARNSPLYDVGVDVMAKILRYLKPIEAYSILSRPISKTFKSTFSNPPDLWKVLCLSEPFYAKQDKESSDESTVYPIVKDLKVSHLLGRYRLLYSSLIKCVRYLDRIQDDSRNGLTPSGAYDSETNSINSFEDNLSLKNFFARAHKLKRKETSSDSEDGGSSGISSDEIGNSDGDSPRAINDKKVKKVKVKFGPSTLTNRLLGPAHSAGIAGKHVGLPWSCAIYSVVNWMVAFADVAGIQLMCLKVLPDLLVDEQQRTSAQNAGLTDIVLRAMVLFPGMVELHTAAFHTLVLLARPLGGKEGMLFNTSMVNASGLFNVGSSTGKSGIAIMLDSMKRFVADEDLQAMSCWSMVNIALITSQKVVLVRLGGISAAANAMIHHPHNAEVQFRALFALINLVIPSESLSESPEEAQRIDEQVGGMNQDSEIDMLNESMEQVANLVVVAMKNFCSSEAILNRACLVLHNISLNEAYHRILLLTPNCYQMLEWCIGNYRHDNVLQQSARGTLQRLQQALSHDSTLNDEFTETLREQHQLAAENSRRDVVMPLEDTSMLRNSI